LIAQQSLSAETNGQERGQSYPWGRKEANIQDRNEDGKQKGCEVRRRVGKRR